MEEKIQTCVLAEEVWAAWEKAHELHKKNSLQKKRGQFKYQILEVKQKESFSILWKTLFVRLIFTQAVVPIEGGSCISYRVVIKGPFAFLARFLLGKKIQENLRSVLRAMVEKLENK